MADDRGVVSVPSFINDFKMNANRFNDEHRHPTRNQDCLSNLESWISHNYHCPEFQFLHDYRAHGLFIEESTSSNIEASIRVCVRDSKRFNLKPWAMAVWALKDEDRLAGAIHRVRNSTFAINSELAAFFRRVEGCMTERKNCRKSGLLEDDIEADQTPVTVHESSTEKRSEFMAQLLEDPGHELQSYLLGMLLRESRWAGNPWKPAFYTTIKQFTRKIEY
ncbi:MAG: hypothetical protein KDA72_21490 [Planctomycetales bacterium]|nr:hypothetical protein [Planctomycetales bacterium]